MSSAPESYFPADYRQARAAFIAAATAHGIDVVTRVHPSAKGPDGKPLFLDVCAIGPRDSHTALLLISGTHGVEGRFGSAVQTGLLHEGVAPPDGARLVMLHALNPFGFAWDRRVNEDNVDINRNFIDHTAPPGNPGYDELANAIALRDASAQGFARADAILERYRRDRGDAQWQQAISAGQYRHPDGLFYGGDRPAWSAQMLQAVVTEDLSRVTKLVALDFHTGLGESGAGEIITEAPPGTAAFQRARAIWGDRLASTGGGALSSPLTGTVDDGLAAMLPDGELTFAALEGGTVALPQMIRALRLANWQDHFAPDDSRAAEISRAMRQAFYIDTPAWKRSVWALARKVVDQALSGLA